MPESPNRRETSSGILIGQIVSLYKYAGKGRRTLLSTNPAPILFGGRYREI